MDIGRALESSSFEARAMGSFSAGLAGINGGAPKDSWRALAPMILALSNLVNLGGPISTLKTSLGSALAFAALAFFSVVVRVDRFLTRVAFKAVLSMADKHPEVSDRSARGS